jgi:hypothetical protein
MESSLTRDESGEVRDSPPLHMIQTRVPTRHVSCVTETDESSRDLSMTELCFHVSQSVLSFYRLIANQNDESKQHDANQADRG